MFACTPCECGGICDDCTTQTKEETMDTTTTTKYGVIVRDFDDNVLHIQGPFATEADATACRDRLDQALRDEHGITSDNEAEFEPMVDLETHMLVSDSGMPFHLVIDLIGDEQPTAPAILSERQWLLFCEAEQAIDRPYEEFAFSDVLDREATEHLLPMWIDSEAMVEAMNDHLTPDQIQQEVARRVALAVRLLGYGKAGRSA